MEDIQTDMAEKKYIGFREIDEDDSLPSISMFVNGPVSKDKAKISSYLLNGGKSVCVAPERLNDIFTGNTIDIEDSVREDASYAWSEALSYYVDRYDLQLPVDFEKHILNTA